jgi:shikimate kinase
MKSVNRIIILGQPGAGKAMLAKDIAEKLGWDFTNADFSLEYSIGRELNDILGQSGLKQFLNTQGKILQRLTKQQNVVITTDASIIADENNRSLLASEFTVYLQVSLPVQLLRLKRHSKPLLLNNDLESFLSILHMKYNALNEQVAKITINSDDHALEQHTSNIIARMDRDKSLVNDHHLSEQDLISFHRIKHTPIQLTSQQAICFQLLAQGMTSKEIARELAISYRTVEGNIANLMERLGCESSKELIALYHKRP